MTWYIFRPHFCLPCLWLSHFNLSSCSWVNMGQPSIFHPGEALFNDYCFLTSRLAVFQDLTFIEYLTQLLDFTGKAKVLHYSLNLQCDSGHIPLQFCLRVKPRKFLMVNSLSVGSMIVTPGSFHFWRWEWYTSFLFYQWSMHQTECSDQLENFSCESLPLSLLPKSLPPKAQNVYAVVWECEWPHKTLLYEKRGFPGGASGKELACQRRRHKRHRFDPWVRKIRWRRKC